MSQKESNSNSSVSTEANNFFVVGIGASAGGLRALEEFFEHLTTDSGAAYVVIQHLSPDFKSLMKELLERRTRMAIYRVTEGMELQPNSIYLIPPGKNLVLENQKLHLLEQEERNRHGLNFPIDIFLESLAITHVEQAIGVILSGTGSDGTNGLRAINEAGGFAMVQDPETAEFDGMPRTAIATGVVDRILSPPELAQEIDRLVRSPTLPERNPPERNDIINSQYLERIANILAQHDHKIRFHITDTGIGIPKDKIAEIFLPFRQLDSYHASQEGTGLGLSISQNIAGQMGSQIQVTSTVGKGSEFWFDLDFSPAVSSVELTNIDPHSDIEITGYQGERRQILVVDDLDNNREVLVNFLTPLGFQIVEASSGAEAISQAQAQQPNLIILDLVMPETDGLEVTRRLRQESSTKDLPIIIVSASTLPADESQCYQAGANAFLPKPLNLEQLLRLLAQYLQLEWITKDGKTRTANFSDGANCTHKEPIVLPTTAELNYLLNLAMEGEIRHVLSQINHWQESQPQLIAFIEQVRPLAETCQLKKLKELLKGYL